MNIQQNLLDEAFNWCLKDSKMLSIICTNLTSEDIPKGLKHYDAILAILKSYYLKGKEISLGLLEQAFFDRGLFDDKIFERIRQAKTAAPNIFLDRLSEYVKQVRSIQVYEDFGDAYIKADKNEAVKSLIDGVSEISKISFVDEESVGTNIFIDIEHRLNELEYETYLAGDKIKMPFGIPPIDDLTFGGIDKKETVLFLLMSGFGKSTVLKNIGFSAVRRGFRGIHFQLEGGKVETELQYAKIFTGENYHNLKKGFISNKPLKNRCFVFKAGKRVELDRHELIALNSKRMYHELENSGRFDLSIVTYEELVTSENLGAASTISIEKYIKKWITERNGLKPDFIIIDSIDLLQPKGKFGTDSNGIKAKIQESAKWMKNIATNYDTRVITSNQTSDIPLEKWNDQNFVITRNHALGDKNIANSFSFVFTGNMTIQEKKHNVARIFLDKLRHSNISKSVVFIKTAYDYGKFCDYKGTIEKFSEMNDPNYLPPLKEK